RHQGPVAAQELAVVVPGRRHVALALVEEVPPGAPPDRGGALRAPERVLLLGGALLRHLGGGAPGVGAADHPGALGDERAPLLAPALGIAGVLGVAAEVGE